ncbi:MAG: DUF4928 family protein [Saprospiraceae bacterium]
MNTQQLQSAFENWFWSLSSQEGEGGTNGVIAVSLVVLDRLKTDFNLDFSKHLSDDGMQVKGASGEKTQKILARFGETRPFLSEGGRTSRGSPRGIQKLLEFLENQKLDTFSPEQRATLFNQFQSFLVDRVKDFHNRKKIKIVFNSTMSSVQVVSAILSVAKTEKKWGAVAQHLVGAKLQLRFPEFEITNEHVSSSDESTNRKGDFMVQSTIFHVTVAPGDKVIEKCRSNVNEGYRVYLLVPAERLGMIHSQVQDTFDGKVQLVSIENFISQNVDEIGEFGDKGITRGLVDLLQLYNQRVDAVERDKSLMIEIPTNLIKLGNG